jgi:PAS domain S-box-containing protein
MTPEMRRQDRRLATFLALTLLVLATLCVLAFRSLREVNHSTHDLVHGYSERLIDVLQMNVASENKVAAVRGYLLTGNPFDLDRLNAAREAVNAGLQDLEQSVTNDRARELLAAVRDRDAAHEALKRRMAQMKASGVPDREIFALVAADGVPARLELERAIRAFVEHERELLDRKRAESAELSRAHERSLVLGGAVGLITLLWLGLLMRNAYRALAKKEADLEEAMANETAERTRYADLVNNLDHSVVWEATAVEGDIPLRFNFVSERAQMVCGHSSKQWVDSAESFFRPIPAEDRPGIARMLKRAATSLEDGRCEHRFRTAHKGEIWVQSGVHPKKLDDGTVHFIGLTVDITPLRKAKSDLDVTLRQLDLAVDASGIGLWEYDLRSGEIQWSSQQAELFGFPERHTRTSFDEIRPRIHAEDLPGIEAALRRSLDTNVDYTAEFRVLLPNGGSRWLFSSGKPVRNANGDPMRLAGINIDITGRKLQEASLQKAVEIRQSVLEVVSHDLRTPLATIMHAATVLSVKADDPQYNPARQAELIKRAGRQMNRLIEDLLAAAQMSSGEYRLQLNACSLRSILEDVAGSMSGIASNSEVALTIERDVDASLRCDRDQLLRVFGNLIGNAVKFTPAGGSVSVSARIEHGEGRVQIAVSDTGIGIPADHLPHIFDAHWRSGDANAGSGLGLTIARGIVEAHGGTLWVESEFGRGTTFYFTLPVKP